MGVNKKEEQRNSVRFFLQLKARYSVEGGGISWGECIIINASRRGMGIKFSTGKKINGGSIIHLKVPLAGELKPASIRGIVKWMGKEGDHFIGGIEFTEELDEIKWDKLVEPA